jgi:predicted phosphodiesterase
MRYMVISDIHGNLPALEAIIQDAGSVDRVWCMGDVVGYGPDPNACVERLRALSALCVAGNHDWASIGKLDTSDFNPDAQQACFWTRAQLSAENKSYLENLPEKLIEGDFTIVHGSPRHPIWEYLFYPMSALDNLPHLSTRYCFVGHTHVPIIFRNQDDSCETLVPTSDAEYVLDESRAIINPGAVGQPRDGDERASYLILDTDQGKLFYRRIPYPVEITQKRMAEAKLPPRLIARLAYGW